MVGTLTLHLHLPGCSSLKEKRGRIKPFMHRLRREFNLSVAETGRQDAWQEAIVGCAMMGNDRGFLESALSQVSRWVHGNWADGMVVDERMEIL